MHDMSNSPIQHPGIEPQIEQPVIPTLREALNSVRSGHNLVDQLFRALGDDVADTKPDAEPVALTMLAQQLQAETGGLVNRIDTLAQRLGG